MIEELFEQIRKELNGKETVIESQAELIKELRYEKKEVEKKLLVKERDFEALRSRWETIQNALGVK